MHKVYNANAIHTYMVSKSMASANARRDTRRQAAVLDREDLVAQGGWRLAYGVKMVIVLAINNK